MKHWFVISAFFLISACKKSYPSFHEVSKGVFQKTFIIGDDKKKSYAGAYTQVDYKMFLLQDSLPLSADTGVYLFMQTPYDQPILQAISFMNEGDSAAFIITHALSPDSIVEILLNISLRKVLTPLAYEEFMADRELRSEMKEMEEMNAFFEKNPKHQWALFNGMYYKIEKQGQGGFPKKGDLITLHYQGYYLNGRKFDSTYETEALSFTYGDPHQVIPGFELALSKMNKGMKLKIVIPSQLGFGAEGTSDKTIRPYSPLLYELELIELNQAL